MWSARDAAKWRRLQKEVIERVEQTLAPNHVELSQTRRRDDPRGDGRDLQQFRPSDRNRFITSLEEYNRESAETHQGADVHFDDLVKLDSGSAQDAVMRNIDKEHKSALAPRAPMRMSRGFFLGNCRRAPQDCCSTTWRQWEPVRLRDVR